MNKFGPYTKKVIQHFKSPHNYGKMENPDGVGKVGNPVCVISKTKVLANSKVRNIEDLRRDEKILSHDGKYHSIENVFRRSINEKILTVKNKFGKNFLTFDHLILAVKIPKTWYFSFTKNKKRFVKDLQWYHADELEKKDLIAYPILNEIKEVKKIPNDFKKSKWDFKSKKLPKNIKITDGFLRLVGYYLAEGYIRDKTSKMCVGFVFNLKEKKYVEDVSSIVKQIFGLETKLRINKKHHVIDVCVNSVNLVCLFKKLCGKGAENKFIPHFLMLLPPEKQKSLILGMWRGDGYFSAKRIWPRAGYSTISSQIVQQLKTLLLRQGIIPSVYEESEKVKNGVKHRKSYRVHVGERNSLEKLADILQIPFEVKKEIKVQTWIENGYAFLPITDIKTVNYKGKIFNLEVNKSKSFVSNALCLHNCGDVMWLYIKVGKNKKGKEIIKDVKFETFGCVAAISTSSVITDLAKGKVLKEAMDIDKNKVLESLGGLPPIKVHCSMLAVDALSEAIYDYLIKNKRPIPKKLQEKHKKLEKEKEEIKKKYKEWVGLEEKIHKSKK